MPVIFRASARCAVSKRLNLVCVVATLAAFSSHAMAQHVATSFAGGVIRSGVPANAVEVGSVNGLAWDSVGDLVFCDPSQNVVRRVPPDRIIDTIGPLKLAGANGPSLPRFDAAGNLYFYDVSNFIVRRISVEGAVSTVAGDGIPYVQGMDVEGPALLRSLSTVSDMAIDRQGNLYLAEENSIRRLGADGSLHFFAPTQRAALAVDGAGNLFVSSPVGSSIQRFAPNGSGQILDVPMLHYPVQGLSAMADGTLFIAYLNYSGTLPLQGVIRVTPDGTTQELRGGDVVHGAIAVNGYGTIAFAQLEAATGFVLVQLLSLDGTVRSVAGGAPESAPDGSPAKAAWFLRPSAIATDSQGNVYVAETGNCRIRKIAADGLLKTAAGTGTCADTFAHAAVGPDLPQIESMAIDSKGSIYLDDFWRHVTRIDANGTVSTVQIDAGGRPGDLAVDEQDRLIALNLTSIARVARGAEQQTLFAVPGASFNSIASDPAHSVYLAGRFQSGSSDSVFRINDDGTYTKLYSISVDRAIAVDLLGNAWTNYGIYAGPAGEAYVLDAAAALTISPSGDLYQLVGTEVLRVTGTTLPTPVIAPGGIVSSVSYTGGGIALGELVSIFGSNFGIDALRSNLVVNNHIPVGLGGIKVTIGGSFAPVIAAIPTQINVIAPMYLTTPGGVAEVRVQVDTALSAGVYVPVVADAIGIATADASGSGQGAIVNQDGTINSTTNAALRGSIVSFYGTGAATASMLPGYVTISTPYSAALDGVTVAIGGRMAEVLYAGAAPFQFAGVLQINARIPDGIAPGDAAVTVTAGVSMTSRTVTVAVR